MKDESLNFDRNAIWLNICQQIAKSSGGNLTLISVETKGSEFTYTFPAEILTN